MSRIAFLVPSVFALCLFTPLTSSAQCKVGCCTFGGSSMGRPNPSMQSTAMRMMIPQLMRQQQLQQMQQVQLLLRQQQQVQLLKMQQQQQIQLQKVHQQKQIQLAKVREKALKKLLQKMTQQSDEDLAKSIRSNNRFVRWAATIEKNRRAKSGSNESKERTQ